MKEKFNKGYHIIHRFASGIVGRRQAPVERTISLHDALWCTLPADWEHARTSPAWNPGGLLMLAVTRFDYMHRKIDANALLLTVSFGCYLPWPNTPHSSSRHMQSLLHLQVSLNFEAITQTMCLYSQRAPTTVWADAPLVLLADHPRTQARLQQHHQRKLLRMLLVRHHTYWGPYAWVLMELSP